MSARKVLTLPRLAFIGLVAASVTIAYWLDLAVAPSPQTQQKKLRIVSIAPNLTDILVALDASEDLVGISDYCRLPEHLSRPKCGGLLNPNFESILALQPTMVFLSGRMDRFQQFSENHQIQAFPFQIDHFSDLVEVIQKIGQLVGKQEAAAQLIQRLKNQLQEVRTKSEKLPKYRTLVVLGGEPTALKGIMGVSNASFIGEMLEAAHGENIFATQKQPYFNPSRESILALQPEVIYELRPGKIYTKEQKEKLIQRWKVESSLPAYRHGRIVVSTNEFLTSPGPRMVEIAQLFQEHFQKFAQEDQRK
jgi:iron complex transport system substrate-binding protein